jgi:hypothetical protein
VSSSGFKKRRDLLSKSGSKSVSFGEIVEKFVNDDVVGYLPSWHLPVVDVAEKSTTK